MFLKKEDDELSIECAFLKSDINRLDREFEKISNEQNEEYFVW